MANIFKRAASLFGRWTGIRPQPAAASQIILIEPLDEATSELSGPLDAPALDQTDAMQSATDTTPLDAPGMPWDQALGVSETPTPDSMATADTEAAVALGQLDQAPAATVSSAPDQPTQLQPVTIAAVVAEATIAPVPTPIVEEVKPPVELKPEPAHIPTPRPSVSFTQLYELISTEVNKRTDNAVAVYERLLGATREELDATRRNNRVAWSVGGVMTAVAAFGAIWAAGEVSATRVEVAGLKQQVVTGQQASLERDQLRANLLQTREASAKLEIDSLKARLDQALAISADRDRLRADLQTVLRSKQEVETELRSELRLARAAATQPVSEARPASDKAAGAERPDAWSILLNGRDNH